MTSSHPAPHKPAELFRADLISAMKLPDSMPLDPGSFLTIKEPWRTEWEVGVQVCVSPDHILEASTRGIENPPVPPDEVDHSSQRYIHEEEDSSDYVMYDLDELDLNWLQSVNTKRKFRALASTRGLEEDTLREALLTLETKCQQSMARAVATEETLGIEYDEQTVCDVCRDHESEDTNDMIFCDSCNLCVHQACYGVATIPRGEWLCKVCTAGDEQAQCVLCPVKSGALKRVRPGNTSWAHLCCALWIPEVRVGNADKMEPITNVDAIPLSRRNLVCCICKRRLGACIKCSHPLCATAYHVTCGFQQGLDMKSRLDMATSAVIHESYCPKHTAMRKSPTKQGMSSPHKNHASSSSSSSRPSQLVQLQESFYNYASVEDLVSKLKLPHKLSTLLYNYWKLKRKSQHNRPLLSHLPIETSLESIKAELAAGGIKYGKDVDENFLKVVHLRHNLEKARNLIYMVQKRERLKRQVLKMQWAMLKAKTAAASSSSSSSGSSSSGLPLEHASPSTSGAWTVNSSTLSERSPSEHPSAEVDASTQRQTRSMTQHAVPSSSSSSATASSSSQGLPPAMPTLNNIDHHHCPHENHTFRRSSPPKPKPKPISPPLIPPGTNTMTNGPSSPPPPPPPLPAVSVLHPKTQSRAKAAVIAANTAAGNTVAPPFSGGTAAAAAGGGRDHGDEGTWSRNLRRRELRGVEIKLEHHGTQLNPTAAMDDATTATMNVAAAAAANTTTTTTTATTLQKLQRLNNNFSSKVALGGGTNGGLKPMAMNGGVKRKNNSSNSSSSNSSNNGCDVVTANHRDSSMVGVAARSSVRMAALSSKDDSHLLRSRTASSHRVRPYFVNHKIADKSS